MNIEVPSPTSNNQAASKNYIDTELAKIPSVDSSQFVLKAGDSMTGDLLLKPQPYPITGNTHKAISYNTTKSIFLSRKDGGTMETDLDMNNNFLVNVKDPTNSDHGTNKKYVDDLTNTKLDKIITSNLDMKNKQLINLGFDIKNQGDVVNLGFTDQKYLQKVSDSDLNMDEHRVVNSLDPVNSRDLTNKNYVDRNF